MMTDVIKALKILLALAVIGILSVAVKGLSICPAYNIIGFPCFSCGMTRAWLALLHGDIVSALHWHPLFWCAAIIPVLAITKRAATGSCIILVAFILAWALRMFIMFPHTPPMVINESALLFRIIKWIG